MNNRRGSTDWGRQRIVGAALLLVLIPSSIAVLVAPALTSELQKALYAGAVTLTFGGLLGGLLKVLLDDVAAVKRTREDAAAFVGNVLSDLKSVYDRVARARVLIPAHRSVKTYGDEMRDLIEARVQLRNVTRALERRADGMDDEARGEITRRVRQMESYIETLTCEFRDNYKRLSDKQRSYEELTKVILKRFAESQSTEIEGNEATPELPNFVWDNLSHLENLADFIGEAKQYRLHFETPLDDASDLLRRELARILSTKPLTRASSGPRQS